uniref:Uncharacterized protein n=1 Tax=Lotharella globosa TaxID=91324 RepID=A0A7S3YZD8_9EUKA|mmetsp:Transcript_16976/g.34374  ORF Transcript_16976/g.34374 Transcript_16976/m.34374 type:complete len:145 (-) Transcript_16976:216-650(-)
MSSNDDEDSSIAFRLVKELVDQKANLESRDNNGWTPLMLATACDDRQVVKYLVEVAKANILTETNEGKGVLEWAGSGVRGFLERHLTRKRLQGVVERSLPSSLAMIFEDILDAATLQFRPMYRLADNITMGLPPLVGDDIAALA